MAAPASDPAAELPSDPDTDVVDAPAGPPTAAPLRFVSLALVFVGGTFGTAAREALTLLVPSSGGVPWAVLVANLVGAFALGLLLEALVRRGADHGGRRMLRLLLGTGFLGGFTTYSALVTDTAVLTGSGAAGLGTVYALGTLLVGALATVAGILSAAALNRPRAAAVSADAGGADAGGAGPASADVLSVDAGRADAGGDDAGAVNRGDSA